MRLYNSHQEIKCPTCAKECKSEFSLLRHFMTAHKGSAEDLYTILNPENNNKKCKNCGSDTKFDSMASGYKKYCCKKCSIEHQKDPQLVKDRLKKARITLKEKYGEENPSKIESIQAKRKQTFMSKDGCSSAFGSNEVKDKIKNTLMSRYGKDSVFKIDSVKDKISKTNTERYGAPVVSKNSEIKKKIIDTTSRRYGVSSILKLEEVRSKASEFVMAEAYNKLVNDAARNNNCTPQFSLDNYVGVKTNGKSVRYKFKCNVCDNEFEDNIENGLVPVCKKCFPPNRSSFELEVIEFIRSEYPNLNILQNDRKLLSGQEIDIYIPEKQIAIECDGIAWHSEGFGKKDKNYHLKKTKECKNKNVKLIHIWDYEWKEKGDIVRGKLKSVIENRANRIYARNCKIIKISKDQKKSFLQSHHIQGNDTSTIHYGLEYLGEIVSIITFGRKRIALGSCHVEGEYELYRYCSSQMVVGGISKLLKHFVKLHNPQKIITYADIRYSGLSSMYDKLGFVFKGITPPNYWYFKLSSPSKVWHRFSFRKNILNSKLEKFDGKLTEYQNMLNNNYDRIWDCGNLKYEIDLRNLN
jgi:hypothetical protein